MTFNILIILKKTKWSSLTWEILKKESGNLVWDRRSIKFVYIKCLKCMYLLEKKYGFGYLLQVVLFLLFILKLMKDNFVVFNWIEKVTAKAICHLVELRFQSGLLQRIGGIK